MSDSTIFPSVPIWAGLFAILLGTLAPTPAAAVPCTASEFLGTTTYVTRTYRATGADLWQEGSISWWRNVTYSCTQTTKLVEACYTSRWNRFWAWGATMKRVTVTNLPLANFQRHQTLYFCGNTPPSEELPETEEELELAGGISDDSPGSSAGAFALVAQTIGPPGTDLADPANATFSDILTQLGANTLAAVPALDDLAATGATVQDPKRPPLETMVANIASALAGLGDSLLTGVPVDSAPYSAVSANLMAFASVPDLVADPTWNPALEHLVLAAGAAKGMASLIDLGLPDDTARSAFLDRFEELRQGLAAFGSAFSDIDAGTLVFVDGFESGDTSRWN